MTNEQFLEESKQIMSQKVTMDNVNNLVKLVAGFQEERLERLANPTTVKNDLFAQYLSPALNETIENQMSKQEKFFFESMAQNYTNTTLIAYKFKIQEELKTASEVEKSTLETIQSHATEEIEKLLNNEKKNGHKFHTVIHDYIKDSQEYLYDHNKLANKGRSMPSIVERAKELQKNKEDKKFNMQELDHPKLEAQQFEREMKLLLKGDITDNQINSALKRMEDFQLGFIDALKKKIYNPTGATEKLLVNIPDQPQLKSLKDWAWEEESVNVMNKVLKIIQKSTSSDLVNTNFKVLNQVSENIESIMLDIGSLKKYNDSVKTGLLENVEKLKENTKLTNTLKM